MYIRDHKFFFAPNSALCGSTRYIHCVISELQLALVSAEMLVLDCANYTNLLIKVY